MIKREVGIGEYSYEGKDIMVGFSPIEDSNWIISVGMETKEVLKRCIPIKEYINYIFINSYCNRYSYYLYGKCKYSKTNKIVNWKY